MTPYGMEICGRLFSYCFFGNSSYTELRVKYSMFFVVICMDIVHNSSQYHHWYVHEHHCQSLSLMFKVVTQLCGLLTAAKFFFSNSIIVITVIFFLQCWWCIPTTPNNYGAFGAFFVSFFDPPPSIPLHYKACPNCSRLCSCS